MKKDEDKKSRKKSGRRKPYSAPELKSAGSLLDASDKLWVNTLILCCLTQRLTLARGDARARAALTADVARLIAA